MAGKDDVDPPENKRGLFRRLFGGGRPAGAPSIDKAEAGALPLEDAGAPEPGDAVLTDAGPTEAEAEGALLPFTAALDNIALDPLEREALAEVLPTPSPGAGGRWWTRLSGGLSRSASSLKQGIVDVFGKRKLDAAALEDLEDVLIKADLGVAMATRITAALGSGRYEKGIDAARVQEILAGEIEAVLRKVAIPLALDTGRKPFVILVVGVNGSGKTTTIGKLAAKFAADGRKVTLGAGDTFRAAAIEQLRIWGERTNATVISREQGADAAGLAFEAVSAARDNASDVVLLDTAGRLQNRTELMDELVKVVRVIRKVEPSAPHAVLLVLDATVGQNAMSQVEIFSRVAGVTGLVMTKLDGTARGGILVAVAEKFGLPVHFIGVGEAVDDLEPFVADEFARAIAGLERS